MKLKIYNKKTEPEKTMYFKLIGNSDCSAVTLLTVDKKGYKIPSGNILSVSATGICLHICINKKLDLPLNASGQVLICE